MFDVRQSKRLFSIVSAGDVPAKMVGYIIALAFSSLIGTENLLWIAAGLLGIAGLLFMPLYQSKEMKKLVPTKHHHYATQSLQNLQASIKGNELIRNVALVSFFSISFYIVANFILYGYIKQRFSTDTSLAIFFSVFFAISRGLTLLVKLLLTNRLVNRIGLRNALLIAPVLLLLLSAVTSMMPISGASFYLFGVMAITADILRSAIQSPVLLATLQPLPAPQRLRSHTIIKGLMDPFAFFASGVLLLMIVTSPVTVNFFLLSALLLFITLLWAVSCLFVDKNYIKMLAAAIRRRTLDGRDISITDKESLDFLLNKIEHGDEREAISVLQLISSQPIDHRKFYLQALKHDSPNVRGLTLQLILNHNYQTLLPELKEMMIQRATAPDLCEFVRVVGLLDQTQDVSSFLDHENSDVVYAAVLALLSHPDGRKKATGEAHLMKLFESGNSKSQQLALKIVRELKAIEYSDYVYKLLEVQPKESRYNTLQTAGILANEKLIDYLLSEFLQSEKDHDILEALRLGADVTTARTKILLDSGNCRLHKRRKLFLLLGKTGTPAAIDLLHECLEKYPQDSALLISLLYQAKYQSNESGKMFKKLIGETLEIAAGNVFKLNFLHRQPANYSLLIRALELELSTLRDNCIYLFSFLYDNEKIRRAKSGFELNTSESIANAVELIERIIPREYATIFTAIFEDTDLQNKSIQLKNFHKHPATSIDYLIKDILVDQPAHFNDWTKSCILYTFKDEKGLLNEQVIQTYIKSEDPIIKEIAEKILETKEAGHH